MNLEINKVDVWAGEINDRPGGLAQALALLADAEVDLECVIARRDGEGKGSLFVTPIKGARAQKAAQSAGLKRAEDVATLKVEGTDAPGLGHRITQSIADAGINMRGVSAAVIGRKFVAYLGFDSAEDATKAQRALKSAK